MSIDFDHVKTVRLVTGYSSPGKTYTTLVCPACDSEDIREVFEGWKSAKVIGTDTESKTVVMGTSTKDWEHDYMHCNDCNQVLELPEGWTTEYAY